jgi:TolB-like protein/Tfp pilus assembly protein PilF
MSTTPSETISHYHLLEPLGRGAMGEVWLAEDTQLPRKVAVKLLPRHLSEDPEAVERLMREAQAAASVDHPAVVAVYEAGMAEGRPYLVMQRVEGETLEQRLARGPLPIGEAVDLALRIADALAEVHALGIVHRDLKPANVVLTARGPKILDFGLASLRGAPRLTTSGSTLGTPLSMSPEQIKGLPPDNRSDLWSLGVILYQALTGALPFHGDSLEAVAYQVLQADPPAPRSLRPEIAAELDFVVLKLLRKDPRHRYARAEDLIVDLQTCCIDRDSTREEADEGPATPRIAVLLFDVLSSDPDDAFLAAGLAEDLIVDLSRLSAVRVATRAEVVPYRDRPVPPRTVARELGVDYVLTGSVRRAGPRARISAQLVRGDDGQAIWTERFDRTVADLFDVQAEVSKQIVDALRVAVRPEERAMLDRAPTRNPEAYRLFLSARAKLDEAYSLEVTHEAEALLKSALELDPSFALAHATLAETYAIRSFNSPQVRSQVPDALASAERALALEPDLIEAYTARALAYFMLRDPDRVREAVEKVVALNPDRPQEIEWAAWSAIAAGHPEEAVEMVEKLVERHPDRYRPTSFLVTCYELLGRPEDAARARQLQLERFTEFLQRHPNHAHARSLLAVALAQEGQKEAAIAQAERAFAQSPHTGPVHYNLACTLALCGERERAIAELMRFFRGTDQSSRPSWPLRDPDLESLRDLPEFQAIFASSPSPTGA